MGIKNSKWDTVFLHDSSSDVCSERVHLVSLQQEASLYFMALTLTAAIHFESLT